MRIIGGQYRSRQLLAPKGTETRPTLDQVRESLFNILQGQVADLDVLDLYGGSGALALEAISRGARSAVICDQSRDAISVIQRNIASLSCQSQTKVLHMKDTAALELLERENTSFDIVFLDPPYRMEMDLILQRVASGGVLRPGGKLIYEHSALSKPDAPEGLVLLSERKYRDTGLSFFQKPLRNDGGMLNDETGGLSVSGQL